MAATVPDGAAGKASSALRSGGEGITAMSAGPIARDEHWSHIATDGAAHVTLWVAPAAHARDDTAPKVIRTNDDRAAVSQGVVENRDTAGPS